MNTTPRLELAAVTKRYPGVLANDRVSLRVMPGEIHAILGENGAGKSTLMKIIYGAVRPDSGDVVWDGREVAIAQPAAGPRARHLDGVPALRAVRLADGGRERLARPGRDRRGGRCWRASRSWRGRRPRRRPQRVDARRGAARRGFAERRVSDLSVGERQRVEILRALFTEPRLLILDEPTSVLTPGRRELFVTLAQPGGRGLLHPLHQPQAGRGARAVRALHGSARGPGDRGDRSARGDQRAAVRDDAGSATARRERRRGRPSSPCPVEGGAVARARARGAGSVAAAARALRRGAGPRELHAPRGDHPRGSRHISGSGQSELLNAISGEDPARGGGDHSPGRRGRLARSTARAPGARPLHGTRGAHRARRGADAVAGGEHAAHPARAVARGGLLRWPVARALAATLIARFRVRAGGADYRPAACRGATCRSSSSAAKSTPGPGSWWWRSRPGASTWGQRRRSANELAGAGRAGVAVLVISEDLPELFELCTELVVLARGRLSPRVAVGDATVAQIGEWMSGLFPGPAAPEAAPPSRSTVAPRRRRRPEGARCAASGAIRARAGGRPAPAGSGRVRSVSGAVAVAAPLAALGLTVVAGAMLFSRDGQGPGHGAGDVPGRTAARRAAA